MRRRRWLVAFLAISSTFLISSIYLSYSRGWMKTKRALKGQTSLIEYVFQPRAIKRGVITITFDDGPSNIFRTAYPIMRKYNLPGNLAVITNFSEKAGGKSKWRELEELHNAGWSILSHTHNHKYLSSLNQRQLRYELGHSRNILKKFRGSNFLIAPFHDWNDQADKVAREYYDGVRRSYIYFDGGNTLPPEDRYNIASYAGDYPLNGKDPNLTIQQLKEYWDDADRMGKWGATYFHPLSKEHEALFEDLMRYLYEKKYRVVTWDDLAPEITGKANKRDRNTPN